MTTRTGDNIRAVSMPVLRVMAGEGEQRQSASAALLYMSSRAPGVPYSKGARRMYVVGFIPRRCRTP
jgi:hypothetical protein